MLGPHAIGKSTALKRWKNRYGALLETYSLDDMRKTYPDNPQKQELIHLLNRANRVCVVESGKAFAGWMSVVPRTAHVIVPVCTADLIKQWTEERSGKPMSDYWTRQKLEYESERRFKNFCRPYHNTMFFTVRDREKDWERIDQYFYKIFRTLNNRSKH